jgi:hypothetical protein
MIDSDFDIYKKIKGDPNFGALFRAVMYRTFAPRLPFVLCDCLS